MTIYYKYAILPLSLLMLASCKTDKSKERVTRPDLPEEVRSVAEAISNDNPEEFAAAVTYPIARPYPLRDVEDSAAMVSYFPTLVDKDLRKTVEEQPDSAWQQEGWRGWTLDNGSYFWIDAGKIYDMTYISRKEQVMLDSLKHLEIASLKSSLQKDWIPVACVTDTVSGAIFRIDTRQDSVETVYRLAGYSKGADLSGEPTLVLYGSLELEGSMGNRFYRFADEQGTTAEYTPDVTDDETEPQIEIDRRGKAKRYHAKPAYWLDHVKKIKK